MIDKIGLNIQKNNQSIFEKIEESALSGEKLLPAVEKKAAETAQNDKEDSYQEYIKEDFSESFVDDDISSSTESDKKGLDKEFKKINLKNTLY